MNADNLHTGTQNTQAAKFVAMDTIKFSNDIHSFGISSNVLSGDPVKLEIAKSLELISDKLARTLGPYGSNTIVCNSAENRHFLSKDGYSILKEMTFFQPIPRTVLDLVKRISFRLVRTVGDGSTTAVVASNHIFSAIMEQYDEITNLASPKDFIDLLDASVRAIVNEIYERARPINSIDDLEKVAFISTNNDSKSASFIRQIFEAQGNDVDITIEANPRSIEDSVDYDCGYRINRSFVDPVMANYTNDVGMSYKVDSAEIFMCDGMLTELDVPFIRAALEAYVIGKSGSGLIFIARGFDESILHQLRSIRQEFPHIPLCAIDIPTNTFDSMQRFLDLSIYLGATPYLKDSGEEYSLDEITPELAGRMMGRCGSVVAADSKTTFRAGQSDPQKLKERVASLVDSIEVHQETEDALERDTRVSNLRLRKNMLAGKSVKVKIGGKTPQEIETRKFLIEDAVYACQSAVRYGIVCGGSLIVPKIITQNKERLIENMSLENELERQIVSDHILPLLRSAFKNVFCQVISHVNSQMTVARLEKDPFTQSDATIKTVLDLNDYQTLSEQISELCINTDIIFDAKSFRFNKEIDSPVINSAETDIEVLRSTSSIIGSLAASNQFVSGR